MDYKKAYKAVLKTATQWIEDGCTEKERICLESVFPELRESEDERIRKFLLRLAERCNENSIDFMGEIKKKDVLAWLEKQKEPHFTKRNALFDKCVENCDPKTVEEVNKRVDDIMNMPELSAFEQALTNFIGYWEDDEERWPSKFVKKHGKHILDMAREELQKEQKHPNGCFTCDEYKKGYEEGGRNGFTAGYNKAMKEVEQKEQKPAEWSEADEEKLKAICTYLRDYSRLVKLGDKLRFNEYCDFLESLRPQGSKDSLQTHWKPTEEQMKALLGAEGISRASGYPENAKVLASLYEQLKKL